MGVYLERDLYAQYEDLDDEEVVAHAKGGDEVALEYLIYKYKNFVRAKARSYFLIGADREDIIQEGMIGLYKAIGLSGGQARFVPMPSRALHHRQVSRRSRPRQKHIPLNSYVS